MTREQAAKLAPIITAYAEGKSVELLDPHTNKWVDCINPDFYFVNTYRIKPQKTYRHWVLEEAPFPCVLREKGDTLKFIPISVGTVGYYIHNGLLNLGVITFKEALKKFEYSIDNSKTWLPCGISE